MSKIIYMKMNSRELCQALKYNDINIESMPNDYSLNKLMNEAIIFDDVSVVKAIYEKIIKEDIPFDVNLRSVKDGMNVAHSLCPTENGLKILKILLKLNIDVNDRDNLYYNTPLNKIMMETNEIACEMASMMVEYGNGQVDWKDFDGLKPIKLSKNMIESVKKAQKRVKSFYYHNTSRDDVLKQINESHLDYSLFIRAIRAGDIFAVRQMLNAGYDVNFIDKEGDSPLYHAAHDCRFPMMELLIERGAEPNHRTGILNRTILHNIANKSYECDEDCGCGKNCECGEDCKCNKEIIDILEMMVLNGADIDAEDKRGNTPLYIARYNTLKTRIMIEANGKRKLLEQQKREIEEMNEISSP